MIITFKRTKIQTQASKNPAQHQAHIFQKNMLIIFLLCSRELPLPCCGLRCSCGSVQEVVLCAVDQNVSILMSLILFTQRNLSYRGLEEALILG